MTSPSHEAAAISTHVHRIRALESSSAAPGMALEAQRTLSELELLNATLDGYDVQERLECGGQGVVYLGRQRGTDRPVAIKVLAEGPIVSTRQRLRFEREVEIVARMHHPGIVTLYDSGVAQGRLYYVMEFVDGLMITDHAMIHDLSPRQIVELFLLICDAVNYAHLNGVIHRDLKPANILVDRSGRPRILDFGLAKPVQASRAGRVSMSGQIVGTLPYLSPEQALGLEATDTRTDVYALGALLYELLTDRPPIDLADLDPGAIRRELLTGQPVPLRQILRAAGKGGVRAKLEATSDLEAVVNQALARDRSERYQSVAEFSADLRCYLAAEAVTARHGIAYRWSKSIRRHWVVALAVAAIMGSLIAIPVISIPAWLSAQRESDRAQQAVAATYGVFDLALSEVENAVRPLPGGMAVRDRLVSNLALELPRIEGLLGDDSRLAHVRAELLERRGDIAMARGEFADARQRYGDLVELRYAELGTRSAESRAMTTYIDALRKLGQVSADAGPFRIAIEAAEPILVRGNPEDALRLAVGRTHIASGDRQRRTGQNAGALLEFESALRCLEGCTPSETVQRAQIAALRGRGRMLLKVGRGADGIDDLAASTALLEGLSDTVPLNIDVQAEVLAAQLEWADVERRRDGITLAIELYERVITRTAWLLTLEPQASAWLEPRYVGLHELTELSIDAKDWSRAESALAEADELVHRMARSDCESRSALEHAAQILHLRGRLLNKSGALEEARAVLQECLALWDELVQSSAENSAYRRGRALTLGQLGSVAARLNPAQATLYLKDAVAIHRQLALESGTADTQRALAQALLNSAGCLIVCRTPTALAQAGPLVDECEQLMDALALCGGFDGFENVLERLRAALAENRTRLHIRQDIVPK